MPGREPKRNAGSSSRLDALDDAERRLIQSASIFGRSFGLRDLAAVSGMEERALERVVGYGSDSQKFAFLERQLAG